MNKDIFNKFKADALKFGFSLTDKQCEQFNKYYELLVSWNEKMNLTAIIEYEEVLYKHFLDSISIIKAIDLSNIETVIDIGTGAGFPGIPLKIVYPHIKITLLDSLNKRITFLNTVIDELELDNIKTIHGRAEDFARMGEYRDQFDLCVSRAVANLSTLSELCLPFVKVGGNFISYKSDKAAEEIDLANKAIYLLNGNILNNVSFSINDNSRTLIVINKKAPTPKKYPRKAGLPAKEPL